MRNSEEKFVDVVGYEGIYQVSDFGRVKSLARNSECKDRFLKPYLAGKGYPQVKLSLKGRVKNFYVHSLVAQAFLDFTIGGELVIDHLDGNKLNNYVWNLEVVTNRENLSRFRRDRTTLSSQYVGAYKVGKRWVSKIYVDGKSNHLGTFGSELEAANAYQLALRNI